MLTFKLITKCFQDSSSYKDDDVDFLLEEDNWNDFGYQTLYHLHFTKKIVPESKGAFYVGPINIMQLGQKVGDDHVLRKSLLRQKIKKNLVFSTLPKDFYSFSTSIDLFKKISRYLTSEEERNLFISQLRLILSESDNYYNIVKDDAVFNVSLLRVGTMNNFSLLKGRELLLMEGCHYNLRTKAINLNFANSDTEVLLDFSSIKGIDSPLIPNGIISFIGKNGSGKSTALYKLASLLYAAPSDRDRYMKSVGTLIPCDLGISQLMIFSYSPFDNFRLPGELVDSDLKSWTNTIDKRTGRFIYCGLRDVKYEAESILAQRKQENNNNTDLNMYIPDIRLKSLSALSDESYEAYKCIEKDKKINVEFQSFVKSTQKSQHELYLIIESLIEASLFDGWGDVFNKLSTGHKFLLHCILHIIAYCEDNAMLLFDEPENHLQTPLLSFLMIEVRKILYKRKSVMLIATHSPVILQETLSSNVRIVRREGNCVSFSKPTIETFGENFGRISTEVFDLTTDRTDYFDTIDKIYDFLGCDKVKSVKCAVDKIEKTMGGLSNQSIHYIIAKYSRNNDMSHVED